jgi:hypothetical protein
MPCIAGESGYEFTPTLRILRIEPRNSIEVAFQIAADAKPGLIGKYRRKTIASRHEFQPMLDQAVAVCGQKG